MNKIMAFLSLFRKGEELADVSKWKSRQITGTMVGMFIMALVQVMKAMGHEIPGIDDATATTIGAGIIAGFNVVFTAITSKRAGFASAHSDEQLTIPEQAEPSVQQVAATEAQPDAHEQPLSPVSKPSDVPTAGDVQAWVDFAHKELERTRADDASYRGT